MVKIKHFYHVLSQRLPQLWCWLFMMATLLDFGKFWVQAINPERQNRQYAQSATSILSSSSSSSLSSTSTSLLVDTLKSETANVTLVTATFVNTTDVSDGNDPALGYKRTEDKTKDLSTQSDDITDAILLHGHIVKRYAEEGNAITYEMKNKNLLHLRNIQNRTTTISSTPTFLPSSYELDLQNTSRIISTETATLYEFNQTTASIDTDAATTFLEDCLANRNSLAHVFTIVLYSVVCLVGLFGNTLVIWVVFRFSKMQTVTNIYILNLAIADECFLIGIPFLLYTMRICSWKFGEYVCKAYMVSTSITQFTSSIFLLIMAADRYIAVCHPIESQKYRTLRIAKFVSMLAWFTSAILMMPVILFASTVRQEDGINFSCNIDWPEVYKKHSGTTFILYTFLLGFATPLCFILVFYYLVIRKLHTVQQKHKSKEKKRSHRKVTRLVLTVITVYILCWLPHWISQVSLINSFVGHRELTRVEILLFLLFGCLAYSNSAMNPVLYAFLSDNFRKSFAKAFSCVTAQEVEAQFVNEHSVFIHKRTASAASRRKGSRRLSVPRGTQVVQNNSFLAPTVVHNSGGGSSSATSASTATTATDKSSNSNSKQRRDAGEENEKIILVVNQALHEGRENQTDV